MFNSVEVLWHFDLDKPEPVARPRLLVRQARFLGTIHPQAKRETSVYSKEEAKLGPALAQIKAKWLAYQQARTPEGRCLSLGRFTVTGEQQKLADEISCGWERRDESRRTNLLKRRRGTDEKENLANYSLFENLATQADSDFF